MTAEIKLNAGTDHDAEPMDNFERCPVVSVQRATARRVPAGPVSGGPAALSAVGSPPGFVSEPSLLKLREGEDAILPCVIRNQGPYIVVWKKDRRVISAREAIVARDTRYSLVEGYNLRIAGVRPSDQSSYTCSIDTEPLTELTHRLVVLYGPVVTTRPSSGVLVLERGKEAHFECSAAGNPKPSMFWRKQVGLLPSGEAQHPGSRYTVAEVTRQMAGVYECVAQNGLRKPGVGTVSLQVQYPPEVEVEHSIVHTGEGSEAKLVCFVFADPPAEVRWIREDGYLHPSRHRPSEEVLGGTRHVLTIRPVRMADFGTYLCQALSFLGNASGPIVLSGAPARARVTSSPIGTAPDSYQLAWEVRSFSPVLEYMVAYGQGKANSTSGETSPSWREVLVPPTGSEVVGDSLHRQQIPLTKLRPATTYDLHVRARNRHGWGDVSEMFHFSTLARGEGVINCVFALSPRPVAFSRAADSPANLHLQSPSGRQPTLSGGRRHRRRRRPLKLADWGARGPM
ncbi:limbic system-associated membrane protein-like [Pollicipes pollicipes]|uniref:limbic system-associated membrane protein-like n=1 Tax=Pollicipes pollicipes TaxID=41117 RepID=UPI001885A06D|nr:limbic system-associated membrane protein-like [Pollicipes pollicipes]